MIQLRNFIHQGGLLNIMLEQPAHEMYNTADNSPYSHSLHMAPFSLSTLVVILMSAILTIISSSSAECYSGHKVPVKFSVNVETSLILTDSYCHIRIKESMYFFITIRQGCINPKCQVPMGSNFEWRCLIFVDT
jgi:hypothetical protein